VRSSLLVALAVAACSHSTTKAPPPPSPPKPVAAAPKPAARQADPYAPSWIGIRFDRGTTRVVQVVQGGPAEQAGVKVGDQVTNIDGRAVFIDMEAVQAIRTHLPGKTAFVIRRDGADVNLAIEVAAMPNIDELSKRTLLDRPAPKFTAQLIAGNYSPALDDLAGHVVVIDFWATWCGPCGVTIPYLDQWQTLYGSRGLRIVGLTAEDAVTVKQFLAVHPLSYAVARDENDQIGQAYLRFAVPMLVVIDKAGVVRQIQVGTENFEDLEKTITKLL
jgi:cytochrome c biogenesis protein CcmG/thiol:disulfide interchange protein DsbE